MKDHELIADKLTSADHGTQLATLAIMHRRVIQLGDEAYDAEREPVEGEPEPGLFGGRFALLRRTSVRERLFYHCDIDGNPNTSGGIVPVTPEDDYALLKRINNLGERVLQSIPENVRMHAVQAMRSSLS